MTLQQKIMDAFIGKVVRKDLAFQVKGGLPVPTYVLEYLLGQYCATDDEEAITEHFVRFAKTLSPAGIVFDKTGSFGNVVLFLPPAENAYLRSANKSLHDMMPFSPAEEGNYLPGKWVPHCSLAVRLDEVSFPAAQEEAERSFTESISGMITRLTLAECYPYREKEIIEL